jgi:hypothetical protein
MESFTVTWKVSSPSSFGKEKAVPVVALASTVTCAAVLVRMLVQAMVLCVSVRMV